MTEFIANYETLTLAISAVLAVFATSVVKNVNWDGRVKHLVATGVSTALAAVIFLVSGDFANINFVTAAASVHGMSQLIYNFVLKGTAFNDTLERAIYGADNTA